MAAPAAYLDECVHHDLAAALRQRGFTATSALDEGMLQLRDESQLSFATAQGWVLITHDYRDFLRLHHAFLHEGKPHGGIVILPRRAEFDLQVVRAAIMLDWLGTMPDFRSQIFRWGSLQRLLIGGVRLAGHTRTEVDLALGWQ